jgi:integrase
MNSIAAETERGPKERRFLMTRRRKSYQRGSVIEKPKRSGLYSLRYREFNHRTGKWTNKRERLGEFKTKTAARRAAEPIMARVNAHNNGDKPAGDFTFRQFVEGRWKAYGNRHQPATQDCYNTLLKIYLMPRFGEMLLRDIKPIHIGEFLESVTGKAPKTVSLLYSLLHVMFDLACEYELIEHSPVKTKLHRPEVPKVKKPTLTAAEIRAILDHLDPQMRLLSLLIAVTGMRVGEAQGLRWMDYDEQTREVTVCHAVYKQRLKGPKTAASVRTLRLHPSVSSLLVKYRERSEFSSPGDFIFCQPDGIPLRQSSIRRLLQSAMDKVGIQRGRYTHGFHIFRHTAGSLMYVHSRDLKMVQDALGHSGISTTSDVYVHLDGATVAEGTESLAEMIFGEFSPNCTLEVSQESEMVS